jgi:hypothetical protein
MKTYRIEFTLEEGNNEFWEGNPDPKEVLELVLEALEKSVLYYRDVKITEIVDRTVYTTDEVD